MCIRETFHALHLDFLTTSDLTNHEYLIKARERERERESERERERERESINKYGDA